MPTIYRIGQYYTSRHAELLLYTARPLRWGHYSLSRQRGELIIMRVPSLIAKNDGFEQCLRRHQHWFSARRPKNAQGLSISLCCQNAGQLPLAAAVFRLLKSNARFISCAHDAARRAHEYAADYYHMLDTTTTTRHAEPVAFFLKKLS